MPWWKNPTLYAALGALLAALGWETGNELAEHILGAVGALSAVVSIVMGMRQSRQAAAGK